MGKNRRCYKCGDLDHWKRNHKEIERQMKPRWQKQELEGEKKKTGEKDKKEKIKKKEIEKETKKQKEKKKRKTDKKEKSKKKKIEKKNIGIETERKEIV